VPAPRHAIFRCSIEETPRTLVAASFSYPVIALACEAWLAPGAGAERIAAVRVEPSPSLNLEAALGEDSELGSKVAAYAAMMDSVLDGLTAAFAQAIYADPPSAH
jgi:hypothetical protein